MATVSLVPRPLSEKSRRGLATRTTVPCPKGIQSVTQSRVLIKPGTGNQETGNKK